MKSRKILVLLIVLLLSSSALCQFSSIGLFSGVVLPQDNWETGFTVNAFSNLKVYYKGLFFQPHFIYVSSKYSDQINSDEDVNLSLANYAIGLNVLKIVSTFGKGKALFGGIGLDYNIIVSDKIRDSYDSDFEEVFSDTDYKIGLSLVSSYLHKIGQAAGYAETKYTFIPGGYNYFQVGLGFIYFIR